MKVIINASIFGNTSFDWKRLYTRVFLSRDRSVTLVNVLGDAMGTGIVQHLSRDDLASLMKDEATAFDQSENNPEQLLSSGV